MSKYVNDVRALSGNAAYMGVVFEGEMEDAIQQARLQPDHGLPEISDDAQAYTIEAHVNGNRYISRDRLALLQHLNLAPR